MIRYILLLRGINVGGNSTVPMPELKRILEAAGFTDVITYINSGNVLFSSLEPDAQAIKRICESKIRERFGLSLNAMVIPVDDFREAMAHAPDWWGKDPESKHNALFVIPPRSVAEVFAEVGASKPDYEQVAHHGQLVFWSAPLKSFSHTRWSTIVGTAIYADITIRNRNTALKLLQLADR